MSTPTLQERIQYRCRDCPQTFTNAETSNRHHDATGHHQSFRCLNCAKPLSGHTDAEYAHCVGDAAIAEDSQ